MNIFSQTLQHYCFCIYFGTPNVPNAPVINLRFISQQCAFTQVEKWHLFFSLRPATILSPVQITPCLSDFTDFLSWNCLSLTPCSLITVFLYLYYCNQCNLCFSNYFYIGFSFLLDCEILKCRNMLYLSLHPWHLIGWSTYSRFSINT